MRIYHIIKESGQRFRYDVYVEHVVAAETEQEARELCPTADEGADFWTNPDHSTARVVGVAVLSISEPEVLCSSFNAG